MSTQEMSTQKQTKIDNYVHTQTDTVLTQKLRSIETQVSNTSYSSGL
jgi:hypothetical protein